MNHDPMSSSLAPTLEVSEPKAFQVHQSTQKEEKHLQKADTLFPLPSWPASAPSTPQLSYIVTLILLFSIPHQLLFLPLQGKLKEKGVNFYLEFPHGYHQNTPRRGSSLLITTPLKALWVPPSGENRTVVVSPLYYFHYEPTVR